MNLPVLVVSGFLGAGKTTLINRILVEAEGRRIAAIVNDFGAINIDAELIAERSETVLGLANGCICCSLQGDLLRTLKLLTTRADPLDHVVIEASGIADPQGIVTALLDSALWGSVTLEAVLTVIDAEDCVANPGRMEDPVWRAQVEGADLLALAKTMTVEAAPLMDRLTEAIRAPLLVLDDPTLRVDLLLGTGSRSGLRPARSILRDDRFVSLEVESADPGILPAFQQAIEQIAPCLLRAKGLLTFREMPDRTLLFQMTGRRATFTTHEMDASTCRLVLIGKRSDFDTDIAARLLAEAFPKNTVIGLSNKKFSSHRLKNFPHSCR